MRLEGIRFRGRHGVSQSERALPQDFRVTLDLALPIDRLPQSDSIHDVFDYDQIATMVVEEGTKQEYRLLESLAKRVIERVLRDSPATSVTVAITKSHPPTAHSVDAVVVSLSARRG